MTPFNLSMWDQPPSSRKSPSATPAGSDELSPFRKSAVAAAVSPSPKVLAIPVVENPVHVEPSPVLVDGSNLNQIPAIKSGQGAVTVEASLFPPVSDREAEFRRRGPPPMPSFGTKTSALSFEPVRKLSSLRR